jgi:hypothetical protein
MKKVKITADAAGNVIIQSSNNAEYGYVKVIQEKVIFDDNGFMTKKPVSALINGTLDDLQSMNWVKDQELEGKVVIREQLVPFSKKKPETDFKIAGKTGIVCTVKGAPIYRKTLYTTNSTMEDILCLHDNKDMIIAKQAELTAAETIEPTFSKPDFKL